MEANRVRMESQMAEERKQTRAYEMEESKTFEGSELQASESKKVRLESDENATSLSRKLEVLEKENKRLMSEMHGIREGKNAAESKIEELEVDRLRLELELVKERGANKRSFCMSARKDSDKDMTASVAVCSTSSDCSESSSRDAATSPEPSQSPQDPAAHSRLRDKLTRSTVGLVNQGHITVTSCNPGDKVLVFWDTEHKNYTIYLESSTFYFINSDCLEALDLRFNSDGTPQRQNIVAQVVDKEYCHAKKVK